MTGKGLLYRPATRRKIEKSVLEIINSEKQLMSAGTVNSPRAVGDAVQNLLERKFEMILPPGSAHGYNASFARKSMADFAFSDEQGVYHVVDLKTHNKDTSFNMPNLTSVERLTRFYEDDGNCFTVLLVSYHVRGTGIHATRCRFIPIEFLDWSCLTIGALGWGQIQIANANRIVVRKDGSRRTWMLELCDRLDEFYPREIGKIRERLNHFKKVRKYWEKHADL